eukprot:TRINITY_DN123429_c0_g1_i1.p1 TRINITY_DN123429_c0_g1~~TRINITY_DN123429_c0_g1_i1.p1  ORF type:complete len:629 (+),score=95.65 TRINITY_DN123429_c0_g1_i1:96-1982(+)
MRPPEVSPAGIGITGLPPATMPMVPTQLHSRAVSPPPPHRPMQTSASASSISALTSAGGSVSSAPLQQWTHAAVATPSPSGVVAAATPVPSIGFASPVRQSSYVAPISRCTSPTPATRAILTVTSPPAAPFQYGGAMAVSEGGPTAVTVAPKWTIGPVVPASPASAARLISPTYARKQAVCAVVPCRAVSPAPPPQKTVEGRQQSSPVATVTTRTLLGGSSLPSTSPISPSPSLVPRLLSLQPSARVAEEALETSAAAEQGAPASYKAAGSGTLGDRPPSPPRSSSLVSRAHSPACAGSERDASTSMFAPPATADTDDLVLAAPAAFLDMMHQAIARVCERLGMTRCTRQIISEFEEHGLQGLESLVKMEGGPMPAESNLPLKFLTLLRQEMSETDLQMARKVAGCQPEGVLQSPRRAVDLSRVEEASLELDSPVRGLLGTDESVAAERSSDQAAVSRAEHSKQSMGDRSGRSAGKQTPTSGFRTTMERREEHFRALIASSSTQRLRRGGYNCSSVASDFGGELSVGSSRATSVGRRRQVVGKKGAKLAGQVLAELRSSSPLSTRGDSLESELMKPAAHAERSADKPPLPAKGTLGALPWMRVPTPCRGRSPALARSNSARAIISRGS